MFGDNKVSYITDSGYTGICPLCSARHGQGKPGVRDLDMKLCPKCDGIKKTKLADILSGLRGNTKRASHERARMGPNAARVT